MNEKLHEKEHKDKQKKKKLLMRWRRYGYTEDT